MQRPTVVSSMPVVMLALQRNSRHDHEQQARCAAAAWQSASCECASEEHGRLKAPTHVQDGDHRLSRPEDLCVSLCSHSADTLPAQLLTVLRCCKAGMLCAAAGCLHESRVVHSCPMSRSGLGKALSSIFVAAAGAR